jgi:hypothetical protein
MLLLMKFGGVPEFLDHHGYGPDGGNLSADYEDWRAKNPGAGPR